MFETRLCEHKAQASEGSSLLTKVNCAQSAPSIYLRLTCQPCQYWVIDCISPPSPRPQLQLNLSHMHMADKDAANVVLAVENNSSLKGLDLSNNNLGDKSAIALGNVLGVSGPCVPQLVGCGVRLRSVA